MPFFVVDGFLVADIVLIVNVDFLDLKCCCRSHFIQLWSINVHQRHLKATFEFVCVGGSVGSFAKLFSFQTQ